MVSFVSACETMTGSCRSVPSLLRSSGWLLCPGVLGGGVDSKALELVLEGEDNAGLDGLEREDG